MVIKGEIGVGWIVVCRSSRCWKSGSEGWIVLRAGLLCDVGRRTSDVGAENIAEMRFEIWREELNGGNGRIVTTY